MRCMDHYQRVCSFRSFAACQEHNKRRIGFYDFMHTSLSIRHMSFFDLWHRLFVSINLPVIYKAISCRASASALHSPGDGLAPQKQQGGKWPRTCRQFNHRLNTRCHYQASLTSSSSWRKSSSRVC